MTPEQKIRFDKILANPDHKSIVECHEYAIYEAMDSYAQSQSIAFAEWIADNSYSMFGIFWYEPPMHVHEVPRGKCIAVNTNELYQKFLLHQSQSK